MHEGWRRGDLTFLLHPGQKKLYEKLKANPNDVLVLNCARRFGKTWLLLVLVIEMCLRNPNMRIQYGSPTAKQSNDITEPCLREILLTCPPDLRPKKRIYKWSFKNGSMLYVVGVDRDSGDRLRGQNSNLVVLDECRDMDDLPYLVQNVCLPMLANTGGKLLLVSTPPTSPSHPFTNVYIAQALKSGGYYHATWDQNPLLDRKWLERVVLSQYKDGENDDRFRQEYLADYTITDRERRVVREFTRGAHEIFFHTYEPPDIFRPYVGIDLGFRASTAIVFGYLDFRAGVFIVEAERILWRSSTKDIAEALIETEEKLWGNRDPRLPKLPPTKRFSDVDLRLVTDLEREYGMYVEPIQKVHGRHGNDPMLNRLRLGLVEPEASIRIRADGCPVLVQELEIGIYNKNRTDYESSSDGSHLDAIDALKYVALEINWSENPYGRHSAHLRQGMFSPQRPRDERPLERLSGILG